MRFLPHRVVAELLAVAAVIAASAGLTVTAYRDKSLTFDELSHVTAGFSYWAKQDYRLQPESGNLPQRWEALPLMTGEFAFPSVEENRRWWSSNVWFVGHQFFFETGNDVEAMVFRSRLMVVVLSACLSALVYAWSRSLFGVAGGFVSLVLCAFCPTVLAHGGVATSDMAVTLFFTAALFSGWAVWQRVTPASLLLSGLALGALFLSKMSFVTILPAALVLLVLRVASGRPLAVAAAGKRWQVGERGHLLATLLLVTAGQAVLVWALIWAAFGFRYDAFAESEPGRDILPWPVVWFQFGPVSDCLRFFRDWRVLPKGYLHGLAFINLVNQSRPGFLNGEFRSTGFALFFPYCMLVKTPLSLFAVLGLAAAGARGAAAAAGRRAADLLYDTAPLTVFFAVYWAFALANRQNVGIRHLLPTFPVLFVLAGAAGRWLRPPVRVTPLLLLVGLLAAYAGEAVATWPNYLSYFNAVAGGPWNGYRHLVDSSLDWGQDLPGLKKWLHEQGLEDQTETPVYLGYQGSCPPDHYGIHARHLPSFFDWDEYPLEPLQGGVYCVSATILQAVSLARCPGPWTAEYEERYRRATAALGFLPPSAADAFPVVGPLDAASEAELEAEYQQLRMGRLCAYLRQREPDCEIGYSILVYRLTGDDVARALAVDPT